MTEDQRKTGLPLLLIAGVFLTALITSACERGPHVAAGPTPTPGIFAAPPAAARTVPNSSDRAQAHKALPRSAAGVTLGISPAELREALGNLSCEEKAADYEICTGSRDPGAAVRNLKTYFYRGVVFSISYDASPPNDVWAYLDSHLTAYGEPVLKSLTDLDRQGRLHEIYGWKDAETIYSTRFIWVEGENRQRHLSKVAIAIWDREAYVAWEKEFGKPEGDLEG